ncbi:MAG: BlaI/MecI/CopY family transcriptional regulator [Armatimonadetes bacterium]|nr:BlaI/MecI/CopY family transcriptional regulator [Armatimonadota bacterium]
MANRRPKLSRLRPDRAGVELALGDLEAAVMRVIWQAKEPLPVEAVRQALEDQGRKTAYTTVMTTLARLYKKGLLERELHGRAYHYQAALSEEDFANTVARAAIDGVLRAFSEPAVAYFVEALSERDPRQLDLLAELVERKRRQKSQE